MTKSEIVPAAQSLPARANYAVDMQAFDEAMVALNVVAVGNAGSGKSSAGRSFFVEPVLDAGRRICIVDPTGVWWGLRFMADGSPGYQIAIFGGRYSDVPVTSNDGEAVAAFAAHGTFPTIIDTSEFTQPEKIRFMTAFFQAIGRLNKRPLHLVIDEADEFAPQNPMPESRRMFHHLDRIVRRGRVNGFRVMLITQRPAVLHKNVLSQANVMIAMRLLGSQDRDAVKLWVRGQGDIEAGQEVLDTLAKLQTGEGWLWAPTLGVLRRGKFPFFKTYDSSRTPTDDEPVVEPPGEFPSVKLIERRLLSWNSTPEDEEAGPAPRKVKGGKESAGKAGAAAAPAASKAIDLEAVRTQAVEVGRLKGFEDGYAAATSTICGQVTGVIKTAQGFIEQLREISAQAAIAIPAPPAESPKRRAVSTRQIDEAVDRAMGRLPAPETSKPTSAAGGKQMDYSLGLLHAIATVELLNWGEACVAAGFNPTSGPVRMAIKALIHDGRVVSKVNQPLEITPAGDRQLRELGGARPAITLRSVAAAWSTKLAKPAPAILEHMAATPLATFTLDELGEAAGQSVLGGPFRVSMKALRKNGLAIELDELSDPNGAPLIQLSRVMRKLKRK